MPSKNILITGGAGYIGSHTAITLSRKNNVFLLDNFSNSNIEAIERINYLTNNKIKLIQDDVRNTTGLTNHLKDNNIKLVMHFAGLKSVRESFIKKALYVDVNVGGTASLLRAMESVGVFNLIFSSSATVYQSQDRSFSEEDPIGECISPYGASKAEAEKLIRQVTASDSRWRVAILRYFNPAGAHHSGFHGENFGSSSENLIPNICLSATQNSPIYIFGGNHKTKDGTAERDYIHIDDLVSGHVAAIKKLNSTSSKINVWNLGTGKTHSVLDVIREFESVSGIKIHRQIAPPRNGDLPYCSANPGKALDQLGWKANYDLKKIIEDTWRWVYFSKFNQQRNSQPYRIQFYKAEA